MKKLQILQKLVHEKFYVHEIAAMNLSKLCFLKNPKKNNRHLNCDWIIYNMIFNKKYFKLCNTIVVIMTKRMINRYSKEIFRASSNCYKDNMKTSVVAIETFFKKRLCQRCFAVNFAKFLRTPFLHEHLLLTASETYMMSYETGNNELQWKPFFKEVLKPFLLHLSDNTRKFNVYSP